MTASSSSTVSASSPAKPKAISPGESTALVVAQTEDRARAVADALRCAARKQNCPETEEKQRPEVPESPAAAVPAAEVQAPSAAAPVIAPPAPTPLPVLPPSVASLPAAKPSSGATSGASLGDVLWIGGGVLATGAGVALAVGGGGNSGSDTQPPSPPLVTQPTTPPSPSPSYRLTSSSPSALEGNSGSGSLAFELRLDRPATEAVTLTFSVSGGSADNSDFQLSSPQQVRFEAGSDTAMVSVAVTGDTSVEPDETLSLTFSGTALEAPLVVTGTIINDDASAAPPPHILTIAAVSVIEGNGGSTPMIFTLQLDRPAREDFVLTVANPQTEGGAQSGIDHETVLTTVQFRAGQSSATLPVSVLGDTLPESDESIRLTFNSGVLAATVEAVGTITNDDAPTATQQFTLTGGDDTLTGGTAEDRFSGAITDLQASDILNGLGGLDRIELSGVGPLLDSQFTGVRDIEVLRTEAATLTLGSSARQAGITTVRLGSSSGTTADFSGLDSALTVTGSDQADTLRLSNAGNRAMAGGGNDSLIGGSGADILTGGPGADRLDDGAGAANTFVQSGSDSFAGSYSDTDGNGSVSSADSIDFRNVGVDVITGYRPGIDKLDLEVASRLDNLLGQTVNNLTDATQFFACGSFSNGVFAFDVNGADVLIISNNSTGNDSLFTNTSALILLGTGASNLPTAADVI